MTGRGPILDRPLELAWLDSALRVARETDDVDDARKLLAIAMADEPMGAAARVKTVTALTRVWIQPPAAVASSTAWARQALFDQEDLRGIHFGAVIAAYPFFGDLCAACGRTLALEQRATTPDIRSRMRAAWGDRRTVHNAVQRGVKTLRAFGVLTGAPGTSDSERGETLPISSQAARWIAHTLLLSRGVDAIDERDLRSAPELFGLALPDHFDPEYGLLERHREGGGRVVLACV